ncbi:MAG: ATP synthase F0 subunit C [Gemmataceae bacterium]|nr:ATP synthase F0 subunit C [Gemmataceae bacterium]
MNVKMMSWAVLGLIVLLITASPVLASTDTDKAPSGSTVAFYGTAVGAGLGAAFTIVGAGYGFGRIGASALESMARQPETAGQIQTAMLIIAALLEGATFFSLAICILLVVL